MLCNLLLPIKQLFSRTMYFAISCSILVVLTLSNHMPHLQNMHKYYFFIYPYSSSVLYQLVAGSITSLVCTIHQPYFLSCHYMITWALKVAGPYTMLSTWELTIFWCNMRLTLENRSVFSNIFQHHQNRISLIATFMGPTWGLPGADRTHVGPMLAPWILLSGICHLNRKVGELAECQNALIPIRCNES